MTSILWPLAAVVVASIFAWTAQQWLTSGPAAEIEKLRREVEGANSRLGTAVDAFHVKADEAIATVQRLDALEHELAEVRELANRLDNRTAKPVPRWLGG